MFTSFKRQPIKYKSREKVIDEVAGTTGHKPEVRPSVPYINENGAVIYLLFNSLQIISE